MRKILTDLKKEFLFHKLIYIILAIIILLAFGVRVWRADEILGFYFDQGRDAKVIWDFWHHNKFFLIGPTTGIEGIFRGPWYYWLIAPFYFLGNGNPVWPAVFLASTTVAAIGLIYILGAMILNRTTGLVASFISSFSFYLVYSSRWFSNPTPMLIISMILVLSLFLIVNGRRWAWILTGLMLGLAMQFGSAAELFYFPAVLIFTFWLFWRKDQRKNLPDIKIFLVAFCLLFITLLPQIIFDLRHGGILTNAVKVFLIEEKSFKLSFLEVIGVRFPFYFDVFNKELFLLHRNYGTFFGIILLLILFFKRQLILRNDKFLVLLILFVAPMLGMLFFQGNYGNVYDYYFTGYYLIFILVFSFLLGFSVKEYWGKLVMIIFLVLFWQVNLPSIKSYLESNTHGPLAIFLGNQVEAVDWIYQDTKERPFNVDVYVPPVISHAYDYLFLWRGTTKFNKTPVIDQQLLILYTLYEQDPPHPERLEAWLKRQSGIGNVENEVRFGGITVQQRIRINKSVSQ